MKKTYLLPRMEVKEMSADLMKIVPDSPGFEPGSYSPAR